MTGCVFEGDSWTVWVKGSRTTAGATGDVLISIGIGSVAITVGSNDLDWTSSDSDWIWEAAGCSGAACDATF